jgi:toxin ParE1/3/4
MKIEWSALAIERITEIADYIAADKPQAAQQWVITLFEAVENLSKFPELGREVPETRDMRIREIMKGHYRIIYKFEGETVSILTVRHGRQILPMDEVQG